MRGWMPWVVSLVGVLVGCGDSDASPLPGETFCEKYDALAAEVGCSGSCEDETDVSPACEDAAVRVADCIAEDISECRCESDGDLECEGATDPDDGSGRCFDEAEALETCESEQGS